MLKRNPWEINKLSISFFLPAISLLIWFYTDLGKAMWEIDKYVALSFNQSLNLGHYWKYFWAVMSLKPEAYISLIIMVLLNIWHVLTIKKERLLRPLRSFLCGCGYKLVWF